MHYVIVGNGVAGIEAALKIRERYAPEEAQISVISEETDYFFSRTALMYAYMDLMTRKDLEPFERKVFENLKIELIRGRAVNLDADTHTLTLEDGKSLTYSKLLLAVGAKPNIFGWDGIKDAKDGVVHFVSMQDLDACERLTPSTKSAVVVGGGLIGIELVECLKHHGVNVTFLIREPFYWPMALSSEEGAMVNAHMQAHGVDVRLEEELSKVSVDANGRVSAVETNKGNVIECQMLGICVGVHANKDWLKECKSTPDLGRGIKVNLGFETSLPDVYAAGDCAEIVREDGSTFQETIWYSAKLHGQLAARAMMGDTIEYDKPLFYNSSKFFHIEYTTVGEVVNLAEGMRSLYRRHPKKEISQRIVYNEAGQVVGFNMLGSRWNHNVLERWIHERRTIDWVRKNLAQAQFDVEFGRAKLEEFDEKEIVQ
jgi:NAD(P)H-nitrite reductase large subunit